VGSTTVELLGEVAVDDKGAPGDCGTAKVAVITVHDIADFDPAVDGTEANVARRIDPLMNYGDVCPRPAGSRGGLEEAGPVDGGELPPFVD
jgi:hypothetical protein